MSLGPAKCILCAALEQEVAALVAQVAATREEYQAVASQLEQHRARLRECDKEISALVKSQDGLNKQLSDTNVERKKIEHK